MMENKIKCTKRWEFVNRILDFRERERERDKSEN